MIEAILLVLVVLWLVGYIQIPWLVIPRMTLFVFNGRPITLRDLLIFIIAAWAIGILPSPFRQIAGVLLVLWVLSMLGVIVVTGLSNLIVLGIIIGIVASIVSNSR